MTSKLLRRVLASTWILLSWSVLAACASAAATGSAGPARSGMPAGSRTPADSAAASSASPGFTGYEWQVVTIAHDGKVTSVPPRLPVILQFSPDGQFVASDGIHGYSGTYHATDDAFTTSLMAGTANGYIGKYPVLLLTINAMLPLAIPATFSVALTGHQRTVDIGSYTLNCHRAGRQANVPAQAGTG